MNTTMIDPNTLTKAQRSMLVYAESCLVDQGGLLQAIRMNDDDYAALKHFADQGLLQYGRIPFKALETLAHPSAGPLTHWVTFTDEGWALAHQLRRRLASMERPNRRKVDAFLKVPHEETPEAA